MPKLVSGNFLDGRIESWHCESDFVAWAEELKHMKASRNAKCAWVPSPSDIEAACAALREQADQEYEEWWNSIPLENRTRAQQARHRRAMEKKKP